jgi:hypothetical protein
MTSRKVRRGASCCSKSMSINRLAKDVHSVYMYISFHRRDLCWGSRFGPSHPIQLLGEFKRRDGAVAGRTRQRLICAASASCRCSAPRSSFCGASKLTDELITSHIQFRASRDPQLTPVWSSTIIEEILYSLSYMGPRFSRYKWNKTHE